MDAAAAAGLVRHRGAYRGFVDGQAVELSSRWVGGSTVTRVLAHFEPPLDLGLAIAGRWDNQGGGPHPGRQTPTLLVLQETTRADEDERAGALLDTPVRDAIRVLCDGATGAYYAMTDGWVRVERPSYRSQDDWIARSVARVARVAQLVGERRATPPVASALAETAPLVQRLAAARGLQGMTIPLGVRGALGAIGVAAYALRQRRARWGMRLRATFPQPLGLGLEVVPGDTARVARWIGVEDQGTGDESFDGAYTIRTTEPAALARVLDAWVRRRIMQLAEEGLSLAVADDEVVGIAASWPQAVLALDKHLVAVAELARRIDENAGRRGAAGAGPYR